MSRFATFLEAAEVRYDQLKGWLESVFANYQSRDEHLVLADWLEESGDPWHLLVRRFLGIAAAPHGTELADAIARLRSLPDTMEAGALLHPSERLAARHQVELIQTAQRQKWNHGWLREGNRWFVLDYRDVGGQAPDERYFAMETTYNNIPPPAAISIYFYALMHHPPS